jgi:regulator of cell morphogenesis and NO signaling
MNESLQQITVGDIVARDFRAAAVFDRFGVDFCCGGAQSLTDACRAASVDPAEVERALEALSPSKRDDDHGESLASLIDHIVSTHHAYVRSVLPIIATHLKKLIDVHGARHSELVRVAETFNHMGAGLLQHMSKEERVLFPYIRELEMTAGKVSGPSPFGTVAYPIRMMEREHREAGDELRVIRGLTHGYVRPDDGCATYEVCLAELEQFEADLHRHVHLENNVLFPRALELETLASRRR